MLQGFHFNLNSFAAMDFVGIGSIASGPDGLESTSSNWVMGVDEGGWFLYAYVSASVYRSESLGWSATYVRSGARMFRLYLSTFLLVCGWKVVV